MQTVEDKWTKTFSPTLLVASRAEGIRLRCSSKFRFAWSAEWIPEQGLHLWRHLCDSSSSASLGPPPPPPPPHKRRPEAVFDLWSGSEHDQTSCKCARDFSEKSLVNFGKENFKIAQSVNTAYRYVSPTTNATWTQVAFKHNEIQRVQCHFLIIEKYRNSFVQCIYQSWHKWPSTRHVRRTEILRKQW